MPRLSSSHHLIRHTFPRAPLSDDWYERAKRATDRCDLELTQQTQGAKNGLADEVVWVSGLFDLNRKALGSDFKRPLTEYYNRFNRILDRGACAAEVWQALLWH